MRCLTFFAYSLLACSPAFGATPENWSGQYDGGIVTVTITPMSATQVKLKISGSGNTDNRGMKRCYYDVNGTATVEGNIIKYREPRDQSEYVLTRIGSTIDYNTTLELYPSRCTYHSTLTLASATATKPAPSTASVPFASLVGGTSKDGIAIYKGTFYARVTVNVQLGFRELADGTINVALVDNSGKPQFSAGRRVGNEVWVDTLAGGPCRLAFKFSDGGKTLDAVLAPVCMSMSTLKNGHFTKAM